MFDYTGGWIGFEFTDYRGKWRVVSVERVSTSLYPYVCECLEPAELEGYVKGDKITVPKADLRFAWMEQARAELAALAAERDALVSASQAVIADCKAARVEPIHLQALRAAVFQVTK